MPKFSKSINKTALKLIDELGLTIAQVAKIVGSGKDGVILKADVDAYTSGQFVRKISQANGRDSGKVIEVEDITALRIKIRDALCGLRQIMGPAGRFEIYAIDGHYFSPKMEKRMLVHDEAPPKVPETLPDGENFEVN